MVRVLALLAGLAVLRVSVPGPPSQALPPARDFELVGFAALGTGTTGGSAAPGGLEVVIDASTPDPARALQRHLAGTAPAVVNLRVDVDLGPLRNTDRPPLLHPDLLRSGVGVLEVGSNKTLLSTTGATLRHGTLRLDGSRNVVIRNLRFRGLWEWDDATRGEYDHQGWDSVGLKGARNVWIDHCDFGRVYDGPLDIKGGSDLVTVSWTRFGGDTEGEVERQLRHLEALLAADADDPRIAHYRAQRRRLGLRRIVEREIPQTKGSLVGSSDRAAATDRGRLNVTFHHDAFLGVRQRTPRMRFGNAHVFNVLVDQEGAGPSGTSSGVASTSGAVVLVENSLFRGVRTPISFRTGGRVAQRGSVWQVGGRARPIDGAALDPPDPAALAWNEPADFAWPDRRALPYAYVLDDVESLPGLLPRMGVIVPAGPADEARLRELLLR